MTQLDLAARFRRRDVRTDDGLRGRAATLWVTKDSTVWQGNVRILVLEERGYVVAKDARGGRRKRKFRDELFKIGAILAHFGGS